MKVASISYMQTFPTGNFSNQKLGVEIELQGHENNTTDIFEFAKKTVELAFKKLNPDLPSINPEYSQPIPVIQKEPEEIGDLISQMQSCTELKVLQSYKLLVAGKPEEEKVYLQMLKKLQNKQ